MADAEVNALAEEVGADSGDKLLNALFEKIPADKKPITQQVPQLQPAKPVSEEPKAEEPPDDEETTLAKLIATDEEAPAEEPTRTPVELDDDLELEVKVDGEKQKITLKTLKENYSGEKAIEKRYYQAQEARKAAEAQANEVYVRNQQAIAKLQQIDQVLTNLQPNINWEELRARDPLQYALKREEFRDIQDKQNAVRQEAQRVTQEQAKLQTDAQERFVESEAMSLRTKMPELNDPDKAKAIMGKLTTAAEHYGYTPQELAGVMDHRAMLVLRDAARYRDLVAKKAELSGKVEPAAPTKTLRTIAAQPAAQSTQRKEQAIINRAKASGKVEDVALTLLVPQRRKG
jgi:hypothetical protein